jgi:hypothetical protein
MSEDAAYGPHFCLRIQQMRDSAEPHFGCVEVYWADNA